MLKKPGRSLQTNKFFFFFCKHKEKKIRNLTIMKLNLFEFTRKLETASFTFLSQIKKNMSTFFVYQLDTDLNQDL